MAILREASVAAPLEPTDVKGKVGAFYAAYMDAQAIEQLGSAAIAPELDAIRNAPDLAALARLMGSIGREPLSQPDFGWASTPISRRRTPTRSTSGKAASAFPTAIII